MGRLAMGWTASAWFARWSFGTVLLAGLAAGTVPALATTDADGDGYVEAMDCDDQENSVWSLPGELQNLHFTSKTTFVWNSGVDLGGTGVENVTLRSTSPSDFVTMPPAACLDTEGLTTSTTDTTIPTPGQALFYLVRARNRCGDGSLGADSSGTPRAGAACDCSALCSDGIACTIDRCSDGACVHDPVTTGILEPPQSVAVCPGENAPFAVRGVPDGSTLHYQWRRNGAIVGGDSPTLTLAAVGAADNNAQITCTVTGACPATTSAAAVLTVFPSSASCAGGANGYEAPNGASDYIDRDSDDDGVRDIEEEGDEARSLGSVFLHSGEFHLEDTDLTIAGRGFDFVWRRHYRSRTGMFTSMGQNWSSSYDRRIVLSSGTLYLYGGDSRADAYTPSPTGCYTSVGFFRELCPQSDGTYLLSFPNHTTWRFASLDGSPAQGRILAVQDSDTNTMSFSYDTAGKLSTIIDTLGRPISVAYNTDGLVSSLTDFGGRQWIYQYYLPSDVEGMPGDLKSVTSPAVTGTPNGNDFPGGTTTTYTYTKNTGQPALDHNLLSVRKPLSLDNNAAPTAVIQVVYTPTSNPASPAFDRVRGLIRGFPFTEAHSYVYVTPSVGEEPPAVTETIVRDPVGNVSHVYFDGSNRLVAVKRYTGRAPSTTLPTDETTNRPGAPLRATDPPFFRTGFAWNAASLITEISFPKLDSVFFTYDSSNTDVKQHANLLQRVAMPGPTGADQSSITESWSYAPGFGLEPCASTTVCGEVSGVDRPPTLALNKTRGQDSVTHHTLGTCEWQDIRLQALSGPLSWTKKGYGVNTRSDTFLSADFTRRGYGVNTRSDTPLPADFTRRGYAVNTRSDTYPSADFTRRGYTVNTRSDTYLSADRARTYPFDPDIREQGGRIGTHWSSYTDPHGRTWTRSIDPSTGHVTQQTAPPVTIGLPPGSAQFITESWDYNTFGQVVRHVDPKGRIDEATYYTSGPQKGYLESVTVDAPSPLPGSSSFALLTVTARDQYGNATAVTDPHGNTETFVYNERDQVVRHLSVPPFLLKTDYRYDLQGRLVRIDEDNRDETNAPRPRPTIFTNLTHDALGRRASVQLDGTGSFDPNGGAKLRTEYVYDGNGQLTLVRTPAAVSGAQPHNVTRILHDEVQLPFRLVDAEGDPAQITVQFDYDTDGGLAVVREGLESSPRVTTITRDGYGRPVSLFDAMGNVSTCHFDAIGDPVACQTEGEMVDGESGPNVLLAASSTTYDEIGRNVAVTDSHFDPATGMPVGDGLSISRVLYDEASRVTREEDDNSHGRTLSYDSAGRLDTVHDDLGNTTQYGYDANGNVVSVTQTEYSDLPTLPPQAYVFTLTVDSLGRTNRVFQGSVEHQYGWDSRSPGPVVAIDGRGNETATEYDGALRPIATRRKMLDTGEAGGSLSFVLDATRSHDDNSRLVSQTDDNGHTTSYTYDARDRVVAVAAADGTSETYVHDVHGNLVSTTDANGTVVTATFDLLNRLRTRSIARAPGVLGTTAEVWKYDGMSHIVYAENDVSHTTHSYDSVGRRFKEITGLESEIELRVKSSTYDGAGNRLSVTYPSGMTVSNTFDALNRKKTVTVEGPGVCSGGPPPHNFCTSSASCGGSPCVPMPPVTTTYDYAGPGRVVHRTNGNGTESFISYDDKKRVTRTQHVRTTPSSTIDDRVYTWDNASNKASTTVLDATFGTIYVSGYDSASRMTHSSETPSGQPPVTTDYTLDGAGNRVYVFGGEGPGAYAMSSTLPEPADAFVNQYSLTPLDGECGYSRAGELTGTNAGASALHYDYRHQLVQTSGPIGTSSAAYDAFGVLVNLNPRQITSDGDQIIEERDPGGVLRRVSAYGNGIDELLVVAADVDADGHPDRTFYHADDLGSIVAVTDASGATLERYRYLDYGKPRVFTPTGVAIPQSAIGNPILFNGRPYDAVTGLYDYRTRTMNPRSGRFLSRDSIGTWGDASSLGNALTYAGNNPSSSTDPLGMSQKTRTDLKDEFRNGDIPNENDFADTIDSALNLVDDGLTSYRNGGALSYSWTQVHGPFAFSTRSGARLSRPAVNTATLSAYSNFVAVPDRVRRRLVFVSGSVGSASMSKLCPGHISCPPTPPSGRLGVRWYEARRSMPTGAW